MPLQVVTQKTRGFICITAHPAGCAKSVDEQIEVVGRTRSQGPKRALVIGSSAGYGLASRIALGWGFGAKTIGVFFEKPPMGRRTATAGYYNTAALHARAKADGLYAESFNGDAYSDDLKGQVAEKIQADLEQVDLVIYSLASPRRVNPRTGEVFNSALKSIGQGYTSKTVDWGSGEVKEASIGPADHEDIRQTVEVMGGEDWRWWIELLLEQNLLAQGARTLAYSYVGPELTWPIYRDGTIGAAKKHVQKTADQLDQILRERLGGGAWVSVNKAVVTQASSAIPVIPLYLSLLFKVMKRGDVHEGCIQQMARLCCDHLAEGAVPQTDADRLIRLDDRELAPEVQAEVARLWPLANTQNLNEISGFSAVKREFNRLFGFDLDGIDYSEPVETDIAL